MSSKKIDQSMSLSPMLVIDEDCEKLRLIELMLERAGFINVLSCSTLDQALKLLHFDPHLVVLDLKMDEMDGYAFLESLREHCPVQAMLPVLISTVGLTQHEKLRALECGASDFLSKLGDTIELKVKIRNFLQTRKLQKELAYREAAVEAQVRQRTAHLLDARREAIELLAFASEYRDDHTGQHARRVGVLSGHLAAILGLGFDFVESIRLAAPLHDVGKIAIADTILNKPELLTDEESDRMRLHVPIGAALLGDKTSPLLVLAREIALFHHERWDGNGYQLGLVGDAIPLSARIVAVADAYDAITNDRPYRRGRSAQEAWPEIASMSGVQFDPTVVAALKTHLGLIQGEEPKAA